MRTEKEIKNKLNSMTKMLDNVQKDSGETAQYVETTLKAQIDMLLWMLNDRSGLPPIDEDKTYSCYQEQKNY